MHIFPRRFVGVACATILAIVASSAWAGAKDYQVTGPILAMTDTTITVQAKGNEKWEIARDATTKGADGLKVGDKVTVYYSMTASSVESKPAAAPAKAPAADKKARKDTAPAAATKA